MRAAPCAVAHKYLAPQPTIGCQRPEFSPHPNVLFPYVFEQSTLKNTAIDAATAESVLFANIGYLSRETFCATAHIQQDG
ncbi:MAG: hypothetical protein A3F75_01760 [Betaproteobacteria bacterium RIFCSPLOWO2_12_FULL_64_23]|nr:MAG: hypothetical protein A3F75_01760 [Betaproteobacteria bacterium RIFCSPLOWO2_12_FULL_64_23]